MTDPYPDPKHRPVWREHSGLWQCLCGAYSSENLADVNLHIARRAQRAIDPTIPDLDPRDVLPTSDWRSRRAHAADDCQAAEPDKPCEVCGCCVHGQQPRGGCRIQDTPTGARCANWECGCEGRS